MLPIYLKTNDPIKAWEAGLAWAFIIGVHRAHRRLRRPVHPQAHAAGRDARHARRHLAHLHLDAPGRADVGGAPGSRLPVLGIIIVGFFTGREAAGQLPGRRSPRCCVGTAIGWIGGYMSAPDVSDAAKDIALRPPVARTSTCSRRPRGALAAAGHGDPAGHLQLHRGDEQRRERGGRGRQLQPAQRAAGRRHRRRRRLRARLARSRRPSTSASPGWKEAGGRICYSLATGVVIFLLCFLGPVPRCSSALLPIPAIVPDPAVHRPADRRAGVPVGAARALRRRSCSR